MKAGRIEGPREETSLLAFLSILLMHRRVIAVGAVVGTLVFGATAFSQASYYISRASFLVRPPTVPIQIPGGSAALRALADASQFTQSVNFYADLPRAKSVAQAVAAKTYLTQAGDSLTLAAIYGIDEPDEKRAAILAADILIEHVSSNIYSRSGVVGVAVRAVDPLVAQQLAGNILGELDAYGTRQRHDQSVEEREFTEGLLTEARVRLNNAEQAVSNFLRVNREWEGSPSLRLRHERLTRDVLAQQEVFAAMQQSYEQARIEEVRRQTTLTIVEPPDLPTEPQRRAAARRTLLGTAVGILFGIVVAFLRQRVLESRTAGTAGWLRYTNALRSRG